MLCRTAETVTKASPNLLFLAFLVFLAFFLFKEFLVILSASGSKRINSVTIISATPQQNDICVRISVFHTLFGVKFCEIFRVGHPDPGIVRGLFCTDPPDPTLESASPSPPQGSIWHRSRVKSMLNRCRIDTKSTSEEEKARQIRG